MKNIFLKITSGLLIGTMGLIGTSCADELDQKNPNSFDASSFWADQSLYEGNAVAIASFFRGNTGNILFWAGELRAGTLSINLINGSGAVNTEYIDNNYDEAHTQFSTFGGYYGFIAVVNELIYQCEHQDGVLAENVKEGLLGMARGWRAYAYWQMYKMYGGLPLRTEPDVILGETDPTKLYMARATAEQTLNFIKTEIDGALGHFAKSTWVPQSSTPTYYWNKDATLMLKGEVYTWSAKVATGDHTTANADADIATAKQAFLDVVNSGKYSLLPNYFDIWTTPRNKETIFSVCYTSTADGSTFGDYQAQMLWSKSAGAGTNAWSRQDATGLALNDNGSVSIFGSVYNPETKKTAQYTTWNQMSPSPNRYMYKNAFYYQFNDNDNRKSMFFPQWYLTETEELLQANGKLVPYIEDFDPTTRDLFGTFTYKFKASIPEGYSGYAWWNDMPLYRLALAYTYLAEIANYEGDNEGVENYINMIRKRAYGDNWDEATFGYHAGTFRENENAILREKDKEFIMEGQRWWDIRRLTAVKGGSQTDHFVFQPESCAGFGLDPVANPWMTDQKASIVTNVPVLPTSWEYKLLWPINAGLLNADPLVEQNPGYN